MDIARYRLHHQMWELLMPNFDSSYKVKQRAMVLDTEGDSAFLDDKVKVEGRYWSAKFVSLERRKDLRRVHVTSGEKPALLHMGDFVPLCQQIIAGEANDLESASDMEGGETWDEFVIRRTREFNKLTRDHPHDEKTWISFANFQDEIASGQKKKSVRVQALEKKISILEKAIELNPDSEELLIFLLENCKKRDSFPVLIQRWENALIQHSGSYKLWRGFLRLSQGEFSSFTVSNMRKMYGHALQALSAARNQLCRRPSTILWLFSLSFELGRAGMGPRVHGLFERALSGHDTQQSVLLWRCYLAYELHVTCNPDAARRIFFRAIHACPWSKQLWIDGFQKMNNILTAKELSDLQEVMRDKELQLKTDIYEILLEDETKL